MYDIYVLIHILQYVYYIYTYLWFSFLYCVYITKYTTHFNNNMSKSYFSSHGSRTPVEEPSAKSTEMAESGSGAAMAPAAKTGSIKVHLPNNGFNIVKFIDNINVKVK